MKQSTANGATRFRTAQVPAQARARYNYRKRGNTEDKLYCRCSFLKLLLVGTALISGLGAAFFFSHSQTQSQLRLWVRTEEHSISEPIEPAKPAEAAQIDTAPPAKTNERPSEVNTESTSGASHRGGVAVANYDRLKESSSHHATMVRKALQRHPFNRLSLAQRQHFSLEDYIEFVQNSTACSGSGVRSKRVPVFTSMANVFSDLYWQMIENFIYTMLKFDLLQCTVMVCVTDQRCMDLCSQSGFPCYNFRYDHYHPNTPLPSALEQIGELKLKHLPKALQRGVDLMMLDLDVGFLSDPRQVLQRISKKKRTDMFVQKDISFVMNRTRAGWRTWYTVPLPNIGLFYCRGNERTVKVFERAWEDYNSITKQIKHNPGKDQNKVVNAMRWGRGRVKLRWEFIKQESAVLLDKIYKFEHLTTYELGGEAAVQVLQDRGAAAVHTTCYEQKTKVMGLKAANAYWNPLYYEPSRRTITKPLLFVTERQLRWEVRDLLYLGLALNRSVIIPNILGNELEDNGVELYRGAALWPGFRVAFFKKVFQLPVQILEPAFYWRVQRDYTTAEDTEVPQPTVVSLGNLSEFTMGAIEEHLASEHLNEIPRIVLHVPPTPSKRFPDVNQYADEDLELVAARLSRWAADSVGLFEGTYALESKRYGSLPDLGTKRARIKPTLSEAAYSLVHDVRLCDQVMSPNLGNRSCFDKCD